MTVRAGAGLGMLLSVLLCASYGLGEEMSVLIKVGLRDAQPTTWKGAVTVTGGTTRDVRGWHFRGADTVADGGRWELTTDEVPQVQRPQTYPNGILVDFDGGPGTRIQLQANDIAWDVSVGGLEFGAPAIHASGALSAQLSPSYTMLSATEREDDYPSVCALADGSIVAVWQSYEAEEDRLYWCVWRDGKWGEAQEIPGFSGDLYQPTCAADPAGGFWVVCPRQRSGDFDLFGLRCDGGQWAAPVNISRAPGNDFNQAMSTGEDGAVYCVWQAHRNGSSDILLSRCVGGKWAPAETVAGSAANEWEPAICSGTAGTWVAWDTYENGSYDIYAAQIIEGKPENRRPIACSPRFEAKASIATDTAGRVFIAWQDAGEDWGKDTGYTVPQDQRRQGIYRERNIRAACLEGGRLSAVADVSLAMPQGERRFLEEPRLQCGDDGRLWMALRHPVTVRSMRGRKVRGEKAWEDYVTYLRGDSWAPAVYFPDKLSRIDTFPALAPAGNGLAVVFHTDGRLYELPRNMTANRIFATVLKASEPPVDPQLTQADAPQVVTVREAEAADLGRARSHFVDIAGRTMRLLRGDTHRHTEISWDGTGDGSVLDAYRYAIDAVALDFFMVSDHNQLTGVDLEYIWWRNYKLADVFNNPPAFNALYGYERSLGFPQGHRNIISARRDYPSFKFTGKENDLTLLYEYCRREDVIVIAHTTGSGHGTRWTDFDPLLEPVIEIFQGCRTSYEYEGAPKSATPGDRQADQTGYQPEGFLWRAWQRGLRLGIISSSDHGSTHYSYAGVYAEEPSREGVIDGITARHTFGATDNIVVDVRCGDHFMGDQWAQPEAPVLDIQVLGTAPVTQVSIIRDFEFVYTGRPETPEVSLRWMDNDFTPGTHLYYVRVQQGDESIAWGSPMWITKG